MNFILGLLIGLTAGTVITWFLLKNKHKSYAPPNVDALEKARKDFNSERHTLQAQIEKFLTQKDDLNDRLITAESSRAAAESQSYEVSKLAEERGVQVRALQEKNTQLELRSVEVETQLKASQKNLEEQKKLILIAEDRSAKIFKSLAREVLKENKNGISEEISGTLIEPLRTKILEFSQYMERVENSRTESHGELKSQIGLLMQVQREMGVHSDKLARALKEPSGRGRWGEIQLRRVAELAGMHAHCDFFEQESVNIEEGKLRPDMRVQLPSGKNIIVDSKVPLDAYLRSLDAETDEELKASMKKHASQVRRHILDLSRKSYWEQFQPSPEFVVLFLPGESFFSAALQSDPTLIETGVENKIIIATPTTLIALLKAVYYGWKQEKIAENSQQILDVAQELHKRLATMLGHFSKLQNSLEKSVDSFNSVAGSYQRNVLPQVRRLENLQVSSTKDIADSSLDEIDASPRKFNPPS